MAAPPHPADVFLVLPDGNDWFPAAALPARMSDYSAACIRGCLEGTPFLLSGWS